MVKLNKQGMFVNPTIKLVLETYHINDMFLKDSYDKSVAKAPPGTYPEYRN